MNYVFEPLNNVANCSRSTSTSSSGFVCQPVRFNKSVHKHKSSSVVNKPIPSVNASERFCTIVKCKNKFYDWMQFLILFSLVTLNYGYLSCNIDCYHLKANTIVNNLTACLIFIKYNIYNFSVCLGKIFFRVLFVYSKLYPCFLISIHFCLVCKLVSILPFTKSLYAFEFFTIFDIFLKRLLFGLQKRSGKTEKLCHSFFNTLLRKTKPYSYFQHVYQTSCSFCYVLNFYFYIMCIKDLVHFVMFYTFIFIFLKT